MTARARWGRWLLRMRVMVLDREFAADPYSPEYLYLIQQQKRLSLSGTVGQLRPRNALMFPLIILLVLIKALDLFVTNQIVQSLLNERQLLADMTRSEPDGP
jgi:hypothetical protein